MPLDIFVAIFERGYEQDNQERDEDETGGNCRELWKKLKDIDEKKEAVNQGQYKLSLSNS